MQLILLKEVVTTVIFSVFYTMVSIKMLYHLYLVFLFNLVVPPPVDSVSVTNTSVSDTEVNVIVAWEPAEYVSITI